MSLATTADVLRYIPLEVDVADLVSFLEAAEEWVERVAGADWDASGSVTETFNVVRQGTILTLKDEAPTSLTVTGYLFPGSSGETLTENSSWSLHQRGKVTILAYRFANVAGLPNAVVEVLPVTWHKLEVSYTASNTVPAPVREAVAMIAAAAYLDAQGAGIHLAERLGDYSYTREASADVLPIPARATSLLRPWLRGLRARST